MLDLMFCSQPYEIGAFLVTSLMMLIRVTVEYFSDSAECVDNSHLCLGLFIFAIMFNFVHWAMCCKITIDLQWKRYKVGYAQPQFVLEFTTVQVVGADPDLRDMYKRYEFFSAVRTVDVQFSLIMLVTGSCCTLFLRFTNFVPGLIFFLSNSSMIAKISLIPNVLMLVVEYGWEELGRRGMCRLSVNVEL